MILYSVDFVDEYNGFAVGSWGSMIKTTDGGNSWDQNSDLQFNPTERKLNMTTEWMHCWLLSPDILMFSLKTQIMVG